MTYYLLPKTNHSFLIQMNIQNERLEPCISPSLFSSYQKITDQLIDLFFRQKKESLFTPLNIYNGTPSLREGVPQNMEGQLLPINESMNDYEKLFETYNYNYVSNGSKIESISRIFHPYEYLFKKIPNSNFSVSKLHLCKEPNSLTSRREPEKGDPDCTLTSLNIYNGRQDVKGQPLPTNQLKDNPPREDSSISNVHRCKICNCVKGQKENFYDFYEIIKTIYLFENFHKKNISILNISPNTDSINQCIQLVREHLNDEISYYSSFDSFSFASSSSKETEKNFDFIFYELNKEKYQNDNDYIIGLIQIVILLLKTQKQGGFCIIKINTIFLKPVLDIIYFISSLYQKTYIMKPTVNNMATFHKYLICKNFIEDSFSKPSYCEKLIYYLEKFKVHQEKNMKMPIYISSIIDSSLPCYFVSKINDINIILGQQQLDAIHQMILFFKNKNKDKMNQLIKMHIYKSIKWCEKFKIPYNSIDIGIF